MQLVVRNNPQRLSALYVKVNSNTSAGPDTVWMCHSSWHYSLVYRREQIPVWKVGTERTSEVKHTTRHTLLWSCLMNNVIIYEGGHVAAGEDDFNWISTPSHSLLFFSQSSQRCSDSFPVGAASQTPWHQRNDPEYVIWHSLQLTSNHDLFWWCVVICSIHPPAYGNSKSAVHGRLLSKNIIIERWKDVW